MSLGRLKKGDLVKVLAGKDKGKTGKILKAIPEKNKVVVEKINVIKKHKRPDQKSKGGVVEKEAAMNISKVSIVCGKCKEATGSKIVFSKTARRFVSAASAMTLSMWVKKKWQD